MIPHPAYCLIVIMGLCTLIPIQAWAYEYPLGSSTLSLNGYLEGLGVYALHDDTPKESPSLLACLIAKSEFGTWGGFRISLKGLDDGKIKHPGNKRLFCEFDKVYQDKNPSINIDEAYLDLFTGKADFRIGIQKFAWGRLDEIAPTDILNTQDMTNPFLTMAADRKIGVPALKTNLYSSLVNCELAWIPWFVPYRISKLGERWFPPMLISPETIDSGTVLGSVPIEAQYDEIDLPARKIRNSEAGIRLMKSISGWELSLSYFSGYDILPVAACPAHIYAVLQNPLSLHPDISSIVVIKPEVHRMQLIGADFSTTYKGFTIRGEGAYMLGKRYFRTQESILQEFVDDEQLQEDLKNQFLQTFIDTGSTSQTFEIDTPLQLKKNAFRGGLGFDYMFGDHTVTMQVLHEYVFDFDNNEPVYLIKKGIDTNIIAGIKSMFLHYTLDITVGGGYDIQFRSWLLQPSFTYLFNDSIKGTLGGVFVSGREKYSMMGQYRDHDEVFFKLRYSF